MKEKKYIMWGIVAVIAIAILYLAYPVIATFFVFSQANVNPATANAKQVSCDIAVRNPVGIPFAKNGDLVIDSANCQSQYVAYCGRFGVFSDSGQLKLSGTGGLGESAKVDVYEGSSGMYTLHWCGSTSTNTLTVSLYNDNGGKLYDKDVKI